MNIGTLLMQPLKRHAAHNLIDSNQEYSGNFGDILDVISNTDLANKSTSIRTLLTNTDASEHDLLQFIKQFDQNKEQLLELLGIDSEQLEQLSEQLSQEELTLLQKNLNIDTSKKTDALILHWWITNNQQSMMDQEPKPEKFFSVQNQSLAQTLIKPVDNSQTVLEKAEQLWGQIKNVLQQVNDKGPTNELSVQLLKLMKQWSGINHTSSEVTKEVLSNEKHSKVKIWNQLMNTYHKRINGAVKGAYQSNATVTSTDVAKWIKNAVSNYSNEARDANQVNTSISHVTGQSISKVEQYIVYMNQTNTNNHKAIQNELIEKFQNILKSSQFLSKSKGTNELLLRLNPKQLGDITVKMLQQNGEMLVKITTTTQLAKDSLESNLQQLKHMFSPQQVMIEKQETQQFPLTQQDAKNEFGNQMSNSSHQEDENSEHQDQQDSDDTVSFSELLMNEKV
ncbi:Flagellar hook-length control protein FliK [Paraliobacillus sp. PM-2]|uniref:flagellar hook-length control protein FliK n=1 Tax=Paraliobacillus sp. PM-2 TaxID=1462524 RepID=UPI00061BEE4F|nr:flagellar hook-length control protein FliK [Paraliobacillus sp. PM-2]CQR47696.1 Flagellar hook-length control protein FliK [Paraliobacillus sp. PM-2]